LWYYADVKTVINGVHGVYLELPWLPFLIMVCLKQNKFGSHNILLDMPRFIVFNNLTMLDLGIIQTLSHNVVLSTPYHEQGLNSQL
jgi:hypothetical protein